MTRFVLLLSLALVFSSSCSRHQAEAELAPGQTMKLPEDASGELYAGKAQLDWTDFYISVVNDEPEVSTAMLAAGFDVNQHSEDISQSLYFEIYHSIQGFESRYLDGPLDEETQRYYDGMEDWLIGICARLQALGFNPPNKGDLIAAAVFREYPRLIAWLEENF